MKGEILIKHRTTTRLTRVLGVLFTLGLLAGALVTGARAQTGPGDGDDPQRNTPLPCEVFLSGPQPPRSFDNMIHLAQRCGIVGTDIEFQSRKAGDGTVHDYAFVGTMGFGMRIYDITEPATPIWVGGFAQQAYQNDVQVRGNIAITTVDLATTTDGCLTGHANEGISIIDLDYHEDLASDPVEGASAPAPVFTTDLITCVANETGGAHNSTINPNGKWITISNPSNWAIDVIDMRNLPNLPAGCSDTEPCNKLLKYRLIDQTRNTPANCPPPNSPNATCIVMKRPPSGNLGSSKTNVPHGELCPQAQQSGNGACALWDPHDASFSQDGNKMFVAAIDASWIVNVTDVLAGNVQTISIIPNIVCPNKGFTGCGDDTRTGLGNPQNMEISHQADPNSSGQILVLSDERGGGVTETGCNTDPSGVIGALHFWALKDIGHPRSQGASLANPKRLGAYFYPNPQLGPETLQEAIDDIFGDTPRLERGCTSHVFRIGNNGTAGPGPILEGFDGVSSLRNRLLTFAAYGAGVWRMSFITTPWRQGEDEHTTWGNTLGHIVMPAADTWSAKEYKGHVYAGDILRGFDVFACAYGDTELKPVDCPRDPVVTLTKTAPSTAKRGDTIIYNISYKNFGPERSLNAKVTDTLPAGVQFVSASSGGTYNSTSHKVVWKLGTVNPDATGTLGLKVKITASVGATLINKAVFTGDLTVSAPAAATTTVVP